MADQLNEPLMGQSTLVNYKKAPRAPAMAIVRGIAKLCISIDC